MRSLYIVVALAACGSSESKSKPQAEPAPAKKTPDDMDERMRHCPVALDGATSTLEDIEGGVRFVIKPPDNQLEEARRRARHIVDFAARKTREGHGTFDGQGGGRMKNCPVVTDSVTITTTDIAGGVQVDVVSDAAHVDQLRTETRARVSKFPFVGATIRVAGAGH